MVFVQCVERPHELNRDPAVFDRLLNVHGEFPSFSPIAGINPANAGELVEAAGVGGELSLATAPIYALP
jgi:hypothetical protein